MPNFDIKNPFGFTSEMQESARNNFSNSLFVTLKDQYAKRASDFDTCIAALENKKTQSPNDPENLNKTVNNMIGIYSADTLGNDGHLQLHDKPGSVSLSATFHIYKKDSDLVLSWSSGKMVPFKVHTSSTPQSTIYEFTLNNITYYCKNNKVGRPIRLVREGGGEQIKSFCDNNNLSYVDNGSYKPIMMRSGAYWVHYVSNSFGNMGIPLYQWYKTDEGVWLYTCISVYSRDYYKGDNSSRWLKNISGWILSKKANAYKNIIFDELPRTKNQGYATEEDKNNNTDAIPGSTKDNGNDDGNGGDTDPELDLTNNPIISWVAENISNPQYAEECKYFDELYNSNYKLSWSTKSFRSIIGMPFHFMEQVDPRVGASPLGKQYIEDIVYDMPIVCLRPGGPVMNSAISGIKQKVGLIGLTKKIINYHAAFFNNNAKSFSALSVPEDAEEEDQGSDLNIKDGLKTILLNLFVGKYARFYTFGSDMYKYIEYVNTLCHLFISFLDIGDLKYTPGSAYQGTAEARNYSYYNDTWEMCEDDEGASMKLLNGPNKAIFGYFQPESQLNQTYTNTTRQSELASSISQGSSISKEYHFLMGSAGINLLSGSNNIFEKIGNFAAGLNGNGLVGKLMGNAMEGVTSVICGNNIDLPEIWEDSQGGTEHTLVFKLVSPYGDRESIFLYVLRPLARLMAMALPRQFGPNSYTSPFLIQAFSKGQFNVQCGIVSSLSIKRCGNGGESHTISYIPTELEVTMTIQDMYDMVTLSNEYMGSTNSDSLIGVLGDVFNAVNPFGAARAARLLFNNIGLIDFCAAFCGFSLNAPEIDTMWTLVLDIWKNRVNDVMENPLTTGVSQFKSPKWSRALTDSFYTAVQRNIGFVSG